MQDGTQHQGTKTTGAPRADPRTSGVGIASLAVASAGLSVVLIVQDPRVSATESVISCVLAVIVGWSYVASGLVASEQTREGHLGPLMVFIGFAWFATFLADSDQSVWFRRCHRNSAPRRSQPVRPPDG
jgi:hypothetical protein